MSVYKSAMKYGNLVSGMMANSLPKPDAKVGDWATIMGGRDRHPAKITEIVYAKNGKIKGYMLQRMSWKMDQNSEGYGVKGWEDDSKPQGEPSFYEVIVRGKMKGAVRDALIGHANPFYDRTF
jgi:hypothetical protein